MKNENTNNIPVGWKLDPVWGGICGAIMPDNENITLIPALSPNEGHGWLDIASEGLGLWAITDWHSFDDIGNTLETLTIKRLGVTKEVYSFDEGETFTFESGEY